jgi:hypothetical protein
MHFRSGPRPVILPNRLPWHLSTAQFLQLFAFLFGLLALNALAQREEPPTDSATGSKHFQELKGSESSGPNGFAETPELIKLGPGQPRVAPDGDDAAKLIPVKYFHRSPKANGSPSLRDPVIQDTAAPALDTPTPTANFEGINNIDGYIPPDTVGAIGPNHFVQAVNVRIQVFNRFTGAAMTAAVPISTLFTNLGGGSLCASTDDGDPIVLYDQLADRWIIAQFANANATAGPYYMSIAISKTSDPTGAYYAYCFQTPGTKFPDYPKLGVWPDGYYMSVNQFNGNSYAGAGVYAFDRRKMLAGDPSATFNYFDLANVDANIFGFLPSSADGGPPPLGTPNYFMYLQGTSLGDSANQLRLYGFHADFANPANATFAERSGSPIAVAAFSAFSPGALGIPQSGTNRKLDTLGDRLMFRLQYRNFGTNESLVVNHTATGGSGQAGVRYYQLKRNLPGGNFAITEQATYAPDSLHRWMGSAAVNARGDLAVGYSVSSSSTFPSIRYAARLVTDAPNGLFQGEATMITGTGAQTSSAGRWGDYSCLTIDPLDDMTFWYTTEYVQTTGSTAWRTRIGSFSLTNSTPAPRATVHGTVTRGSNGLPITNAVVRTASGYSRNSATNGTYSMLIVPGTNDFFVEAPGIGTNQYLGVVLTNGENRLLDAVLGLFVAQPSISSTGWVLRAEGCPPGNGVIDPNEWVTIDLGLKNTGTANTTNLTVTLLATNGVASPSAAGSYGALSTNGVAATASFSFQALGTCGGTVSPTFRLQDGANVLGQVAFTAPLGVITLLPWQNFDSNSTPTLPSGWSSLKSGAQSNWVTSASSADSLPNAAFSPDVADVGVNELDSPAVTLPAGQAQMSFRHNYNLESGYDGGVLELSVNGGTYQDILTAGGTFASGGYSSSLSSSFSNPLGGRSAWTGNSAGFITTIINLPAAAAGQSARFRWRCGTDNGVGSTGWYVDSITISGTACCSYVPLAPVITNQPQSQAVVPGTNVTFFVGVSGSEPLVYQWHFQGTDIPSATRSSYSITNVSSANEGVYDVFVSNPSGATNSPPATLTVVTNTSAEPPTITSTTASGDQFQFNVNGTTDAHYVIQVSTNLASGLWENVQTNTAPFVFTDTNITLHPQRFYRALIAP